MSVRIALDSTNAHRAKRQAASRDLIAYVLVVGLGLVLALGTLHTAPRPLALGLALLLVTIAAWVVKPIVGLCATVFFTFIGDQVTSPWYPFTKGLSAQETIMFVNNRLIASPLELCLLCGFVALFIRYLRGDPWPFAGGRARRYLVAFELFVVVGLVNGVSSGGDRHIALFQMRPFFALIAAYTLASSVCRTRASYRYVLWSMLAAIELHAIISLIHVSQLSAGDRHFSEGLVDHSAVMRMDVLVIVVAASWLFRGNSLRQRLITTIMLGPVAVIYMIAERRAAIIGLIVGLGLIAIVLFWRQRKTFMRIVPIFAVVLAGYVGAFWNSQSSAGFPAQAVKSVISPSQATERNQGSDQYRVIESYDLNFTIRQNKLLGLGLGQAFYRPAPLPSLSGFGYNAYIPHNSILWVWISFGFGGFVAFFCLLGRTIALGAQSIRTADGGRDLTVLLTFVVAIVIFVVFAAVDVAWEIENMVMLGVAIAAATNYPTRARAPRARLIS